MEWRAAWSGGSSCDAPARGRRVWPAVYSKGGAVGRPATVPGILSEDRVTPSSLLVPARHGRIAIMTMVYNEHTNLPVWLRHYRRTAPTANLFVIDHSSDDGSTALLPGVTRIPLPRHELDERDRTFLINSLQQGFLRYYDIVIYTDCDELLVPNPARSAALDAYLLDQPYSYASPVGINVLHIADIEPRIDFARPLLSQRRYGQFQSSLCKPLVTRVAVTWEPGFHSCNRPPNIDKSLYLFHIKKIDKDEALRRHHIVEPGRTRVRARNLGNAARDYPPLHVSDAPLSVVQTNRRSLILRRDVIEDPVRAGTNQRHRRDRGDRDQPSDQAVFDRGRPVLV